MKKQILLVLLTASVALIHQNCAKITFADENGNINKSAVDGTLDDDHPKPGDDKETVVQFPDSQQNRMSVAFEDLLKFGGHSSSSDLDYNDFVMSYNVRETSKNGFIKKIEIIVTPQARKAGYEAQLLLSLQGSISDDGEDNVKKSFLASTGVTAVLEHLDQDNKVVSSDAVDITKPVTLFKKTSEVFISQNANLQIGTSADAIRVRCQEKAKRTARLTIIGFLPTADNKSRPSIEVNRYPFYLYVEPTKTLMGTVDLQPDHKSKDGYPMGIQVAGTFLHPADQVDIKSVYPYFNLYYQSLNGTTLSSADEIKAQAWSQWLAPDWSKKLACSPEPTI